MTNREISDHLSTTAKLMELHGVNEFKVRSVANAAFTINRLEEQLESMSEEEIGSIKGIGKSLSQKIVELLSSGTTHDLDELLEKTPAGVVEILRIKGIGPKKVALLWKELEVESPGELLYACNENRLVELKGFGSKTQELIKKNIEFSDSNKGYFHYASVEEIALQIVNELTELTSVQNAFVTGDLRRKTEVLKNVDLVVSVENTDTFKEEITGNKFFAGHSPEFSQDLLSLLFEEDLKVIIHITKPSQFYYDLLVTTGNDIHINELQALDKKGVLNSHEFSSEKEIYEKLGLQFVEPELREGLGEVDLAKAGTIPGLIEFNDLKGSLHNHSTYSDGSHTLEEMAVECKNLGYQYLGICDHSKSAFYANGMSVERITQQHLEIDKLNEKLAPFVIFKGIESDILHDGSLDYPDEVLQTFDFIVASVHSGLKMSEAKATERLIKAISNPYTTILGHPTGRLLLAREGYPIDHKAVIDACAKHNVIIELNAHPYRLDLDWRWIRYATGAGVMISINPDAHHISGYHDMYYGVCVARKGMLTRSQTFNALGRDEVAAKFAGKRLVSVISR